MNLSVTSKISEKIAEYLKNILKIENVFINPITVTQQSSNSNLVNVLLKDGTMQEINGLTLEQIYTYIKTNGEKIDTQEKIYRYGINIAYSETNPGHASVSYNNGVNGTHNQFTNRLDYYPAPKNKYDAIKTFVGTVPGKASISEQSSSSSSHIDTTLFAINETQQNELIKFVNNATNNPQVYHILDMNCLESQQGLFTAIGFRGSIIDYITINNELPSNILSLSKHLNRRANCAYSPVLNFMTNTNIKKPLNMFDRCHYKPQKINVESGSDCYEKKALTLRDNLNKKQLPLLPCVTTFGTRAVKTAFQYPDDTNRYAGNDKIPKHIGEPLSKAVGCFSSCYHLSQGVVPALMYEGIDRFIAPNPAFNKEKNNKMPPPSAGLSIATLFPFFMLDPLYAAGTVASMCLGGLGGEYVGNKINDFLYPKDTDSIHNESAKTEQPKPVQPEKSEFMKYEEDNNVSFVDGPPNNNIKSHYTVFKRNNNPRGYTW